MKKLFILSVLVLISAMALNAATIKLNALGQSPFYGYVKDSETARMVVKDNIGAVKYALNITGYDDGLFFALCEQINRVEVSEKEVVPGTELNWMLFKNKRGFNKVLQDVEWNGKESFTGFLFDIYYQGYLYEFIIPQICGNISLFGIVGAAVIEEEEAFTKLEKPRIIEEDIRPEPEQPVRVETSFLPRVTGALDIAGAMVRKCYGKYLPATRIGLSYRLDSKDKFAFVATVGFAMPMPINQRDTWEPFFITDLALRSRIYKPLSFGIGAGYSSAARNYKVPAYWEAVANIGVKVKETTLFFETRLAKFSGSKIPHKFIFGVRLPIKK